MKPPPPPPPKRGGPPPPPKRAPVEPATPVLQPIPAKMERPLREVWTACTLRHDAVWHSGFVDLTRKPFMIGLEQREHYRQVFGALSDVRVGAWYPVWVQSADAHFRMMHEDDIHVGGKPLCQVVALSGTSGAAKPPPPPRKAPPPPPR